MNHKTRLNRINSILRASGDVYLFTYKNGCLACLNRFNAINSVITDKHNIDSIKLKNTAKASDFFTFLNLLLSL